MNFFSRINFQGSKINGVFILGIWFFMASNTEVCYHNQTVELKEIYSQGGNYTSWCGMTVPLRRSLLSVLRKTGLTVKWNVYDLFENHFEVISRILNKIRIGLF